MRILIATAISAFIVTSCSPRLYPKNPLQEKNEQATSINREKSSDESLKREAEKRGVKKRDVVEVNDTSKKATKKELGVRNGTPNTTDTNVGVLYDATNLSRCTGTLISPDIVLTAAHCVSNIINSNQPLSNLRFYNPSAFTQADLNNGFSGKPYAIKIRYLSIPTTPSYAEIAKDLALIKLSQNIANYNPQGLRFYQNLGANPYVEAPADLTHQITGYGLDADSQGDFIDGRRKSGNMQPIESPAPGVLQFLPGATNQIGCSGDSGSAVTYLGYILGVFSATNTGSCGNIVTAYVVSINSNASWISNTLAELNHPCEPLAADFDPNNQVDGSDFLTWQRGLGAGKAFKEGDADHNSVVDGADLQIWKNTVGQMKTCP